MAIDKLELKRDINRMATRIFTLSASLVFFLIILSGCSSTASIANTKAVSTQMPTLIPTITTSPSASVLHTPSEENTFLKTQCIQVQNSLPQGHNANGFLVFQDQNGYPPSTNILDLKNNSLYLANQPQERIYLGDASPDGKWIAYERYYVGKDNNKNSKSEFVIASLDPDLQQFAPDKIMTMDSKWLFPRWLGNTHILIIIPDPSSQNVVASTVLVWNPFTNEKKIIRPEFPDIYEISGAINPSWGYGVVLYNPTLTRAFYLTGSGVTSVGYQLWDMEKGESIAKFELYNNTNIPPRWSLDGSRLALVDGQGDGEISIIEADGKISQLTHVGESLKYWEIQNLNWSPDGQYIAFSLWSKLSDSDTKADNKIATLAIADIKTGKVVDTCIPIGNDYGMRNLDMLWSPTDKQLVVKDESAHDYNNPNSYNRLILVDLEQGVAAQVAEFMNPFGWMIPQK
jgi:Tol biopolymer transport system component